MLLQGLLLIDPAEAPRPGWIRVEGGRIAEMHADRHAPPPGAESLPAPLGGAGRLISPGFIDAHIHLPQIDSVGCDGMPLLEWLDAVVFPAEVWWARGGATHLLRTSVMRMLASGTLGFAGYLTSDAESGARAARALAAGAGLPGRMRAAVGRVAMDRNAPAPLLDCDLARRRLDPTPSPTLPDPGGERVEISLNPRFAVACTDELLAEIGWAWKERADRAGPNERPPLIQTHLAESLGECELVAEQFPEAPHYTGVYDRFDLLTERTLLAHALHLRAEEWELIAQRGSVVVHCPGANTFLKAGTFDLRRASEHGVRVALGSDVAAGPDVAMARVARQMIEVAKLRALLSGEAVPVPTPAEAWRMITAGNADLLGWSDQGRIEVGARADLLIWRPPDTWIDEHLLGRLIYNFSPRLIETIVLDGRPIEADTIHTRC